MSWGGGGVSPGWGVQSLQRRGGVSMEGVESSRDGGGVSPERGGVSLKRGGVPPNLTPSLLFLF